MEGLEPGLLRKSLVQLSQYHPPKRLKRKLRESHPPKVGGLFRAGLHTGRPRDSCFSSGIPPTAETVRKLRRIPPTERGWG